MPFYAMLTTLGPDGWATVREHPERIEAVRHEVEQMGLRVVVQYALMGQWDFLNIIEAPDERAMANAAVARCRPSRSRISSPRSSRPRPPTTERATARGARASDPPGLASAVLPAHLVLGEEGGEDRVVVSPLHPVADRVAVDDLDHLESA
jgi:hypothetical protein